MAVYTTQQHQSAGAREDLMAAAARIAVTALASS